MIPWKKISHSTGSVALLAALVGATSGEVAYAADTGVALQPLKLATCPTGDVCAWEQQNYQGLSGAEVEHDAAIKWFTRTKRRWTGSLPDTAVRCTLATERDASSSCADI
ncbi:MAG: peptidase inhibitor family I36 protein [Pseudonocardiaceae bacterium]